ncbi:Hsp20/alpha crystallin family protein [bacterium]|nr:Hsp20/alpha crystallin family protein [bacterium]
MMLEEFIDRSNPLRAMNLIQNEINRIFDSTLATGTGAHPPVNVWAAEDEAVVTAELPGMNAADIRLSVQDNSLMIEGERKEFKPKEGDTVHRAERRFGPFSRPVDLPFRVDAEKIRAVYANGVLTVHLPKHEAEKPRKIQITAA